MNSLHCEINIIIILSREMELYLYFRKKKKINKLFFSLFFFNFYNLIAINKYSLVAISIHQNTGFSKFKISNIRINH